MLYKIIIYLGAERISSITGSLSLLFHERVDFDLLGSRGNQRDKDRERAQARNAKKGPKSGHNDTLTPEQRRERDAKALQEKAARKAAQAAGQGNNDSIKSCRRK
ncbi:hypothetical protein SUGI_0367130 [Cryptomeria japonica]|nr:hypothetical protein SUGI_0367130 [Cryptomeria japonica]